MSDDNEIKFIGNERNISTPEIKKINDFSLKIGNFELQKRELIFLTHATMNIFLDLFC